MIHENKLWPHALEPLTQIIREFDYPISVLEVGTWFGKGSMSLWLTECKDNSNLTVVDAWRPYASEKDLASYPDYAEDDLATKDAFLSTFDIIKNFEENNRERCLEINMIRGDSRNVLPKLKNDQFDFIYIDGDHKYDPVKKEIQNAKRLIKKDFGIICGDDYETYPTDELLEIARNNKTTDYINNCHTGVLLAVHEEFASKVNKYNSTWWIYCIDGKFTTVNLNTKITLDGFYKG